MIWNLISIFSIAFASQVKELKLKPADVGLINTAIGYSTVLQLTQKPQNVVLGDQSAFRIEFINDSITIKPLKFGAKSNIFVFTESDRFNLTVKSGNAALVDYVVRIRRVFPDRQKINLLNLISTQRNLKLTILRATEKDSELFLDFNIKNLRHKSLFVRPDTFRFSACNFFRPIRSPYIENQNLAAGSSTAGTLLVPLTSIKDIKLWFTPNDETPISFQFKRVGVKSEAKNAI